MTLGHSAADQKAAGELAYRRQLADVIMLHATKAGTIDNAEAFRQVAAVTDRTLGTVRNWLMHRTFLPDVYSLVQIARHWSIPPELFFFSKNDSQLHAGDNQAHYAREPIVSSAAGGAVIVPFYGANDPAILDKVLTKYSENPRSLVLVRYMDTDMQDQIRAGELITVDSSIEEIVGNGLYYLRFFTKSGSETSCVRAVEILLAEDAVRLRCGSATNSVEVVALDRGQLPAHITVLGRVVAVLRQA